MRDERLRDVARRRLHLMRSLLQGDPADAPGHSIMLAVATLGGTALVLANVAGAAVVFGLLAYVLPVPPEVDRASLIIRNFSVGAVYVVAAVSIGLVTGLRRSMRQLVWLRDDRDPYDDEMDASIRLPLSISLMQARYWLGATALFVVLNVRTSFLVAVELAITMLVGTAVMASVSYLLLQRIGRPVVARALESEPPGRRRVPGVLLRTFLVWGLGTGLPLGGVALVIGVGRLVGADDSDLSFAALILSLVALASGFATILLFGGALAGPLRQMRAAVRVMETGNFDVSVPVYDASELGYLQASLNRMAAGLRERERMRDLFGRHVGPDVAHRALEAGTVSLGGELRPTGVLFVDIIGSTRFTSENDPEVVVEELNRFFGLVVEVVHDNGGLVNKFEGDAALCVWGAPLEHPDPAGAALRAARQMLQRLATGGTLPAAIGVSAGDCVAGNIGAQDRLEYTVIGDPVIEAARLTELAKGIPGRILATAAAVDAAGEEEAAHWKRTGEKRLRGRTDRLGVAVPLG